MRGREKAMVSIFHLRTPGKVCVSPVPFEAGSEIHTIMTYIHKIRTIGLAGIKLCSKHKIGNRIFWISRSGLFIALQLKNHAFR